MVSLCNYLGPAEIKEIKEILMVTQKFTEITEMIASLFNAQPVPEALSVISVNFCVTIKISFISFISAGP